jgi:hypothetical protein
MEILGLCSRDVRLPLAPVSDGLTEALRGLMTDL